jgi:hypothetical protein
MKTNKKDLFDLSKLFNFRSKINETDIFIKSSEKKNWNLICAVMDRLDSSAKYLNELIVDSEEKFIMFLVFGDIIINCIQELCKNLKIKYPLENDFSCFHEKDLNGSFVSDDKFFAYIRALAFAHCENCSRHKSFIKSGEIQYSPFVFFSYIGDDGKCGLRIYSSLDINSLNDKLFNFSDLKRFIKKRFCVISICDKKVEKIISDYKKEWMKTNILFNSSKPELTALDIEKVGKERYQEGIEDLGKQIYLYLQIEITDSRNASFVDKYKKAIIKSLPEIVLAINNINQDEIDNADIWNILSPKWPNTYNGIGYDLSKIFDYLQPDRYSENFNSTMLGVNPNCDLNLAWGYKRLESFKINFSDKFIFIDYAISKQEINFLINCFLFLFNEKEIVPIDSR